MPFFTTRMNGKQKAALFGLIAVLILVFSIVRPEKSITKILETLKTNSSSEWPSINGGWGTGGGGGTGEPRSTTFIYELSDTSKTQGITPYGEVIYDAKLVRVYGDGRRETVIESLRNRFGNIINQPNQALVKYYFPPGSDALYFNFKNYYLSGTSNRYHIYRYDVSTDNMKDLYSNRHLGSFVSPSPYDWKLSLGVDDESIRTYKRLYLVNIESDSAMLLFELRGEETLATSPLTAESRPPADLFWIDQHTIEYGVYKPVNGGSQMQLVEKRRISI